MTLNPFTTHEVTARTDLAPYAVNKTCATPRCDMPTAHAHHIYRRSALGKPAWWIELPDGTVLPNVVGLCFSHHDDVTGTIGGHKAQITWIGKKFIWHDGIVSGRPLDPQPGAKAQNVVTVISSPSIENPLLPKLLPQTPIMWHEDTTMPSLGNKESGLEPGETCPTCQRKIPKPVEETKTEDGPPKRVKSLAIPLWARTGGEDGHHLLSANIEHAAGILEAKRDVNIPPRNKGREYAALMFVLVEWLQAQH